MATVTRFQDLSEQLSRGTHNFGTHVFKVVLTNTAPNAATNTALADITQITAGNGYTSGGTATTITLSETGGTTTIQGTSVTFTASGGAMGTFRYYVLVNDTATTPVTKPLVAYWDHGTAVTLNSGDSFVISFNGTTPGTVLTLS